MVNSTGSHDPIAACAQMVHEGDPDRFLATMTGNLEQRKRLFVLYAFNVEIARAPFMSQEPMVAMIRLQFWRDVVEAGVMNTHAPRHDVATPLSILVAERRLEASLLLRMIEARESDIHDSGRVEIDDIRRYARDTSGALMLAGAQLCDRETFHGQPQNVSPVRLAYENLGEALGIANWLMAQPALSAAGRGHITPSDKTVRALAASGLENLSGARKTLGKKGNPALRSAWRLRPILQQALKTPQDAAQGLLGGSEFYRRGWLLYKSLFNTW